TGSLAASWLESYYLDDEFLSFNLESRSMPWESLVNCQTLGYTRRRSESKRWRKKYVSLNLVYSYWVNLGGYREIGDARAYNDLLDDRARHHRIDHRRLRYPHVFAPDKQTISSRRPHFFHTGRDPGSLHLLLAEDSFSPGQPVLAHRRPDLVFR